MSNISCSTHGDSKSLHSINDLLVYYAAYCHTAEVGKRGVPITLSQNMTIKIYLTGILRNPLMLFGRKYGHLLIYLKLKHFPVEIIMFSERMLIIVYNAISQESTKYAIYLNQQRLHHNYSQFKEINLYLILNVVVITINSLSCIFLNSPVWTSTLLFW